MIHDHITHGTRAHDANKMCPKAPLVNQTPTGRKMLKRIHKKKSRSYGKKMIMLGLSRYRVIREQGE